MVLEEVKAAVRKAADKPEPLSRIRYWEWILGSLSQQDAFNDYAEPLSDCPETLNKLWNRRISAYSVGKMFREFGLDPGLNQPDILIPEDVKELLCCEQAGRDGGADRYQAVLDEMHVYVEDLTAFAAVKSEICELRFADLEETDRFYASDEQMAVLADSVRESLEKEFLVRLKGIVGEEVARQLLDEVLEILIQEMGVSVIVENNNVAFS